MSVAAHGQLLRALSTGSREGDFCERAIAFVALTSSTLIWTAGASFCSTSWSNLLMLSSVGGLFIAVTGIVLKERLCGVSLARRFRLRRRRPGNVIPLPTNVTIAVDAMARSDGDISRNGSTLTAELTTVRAKLSDLVSGMASEVEGVISVTAGATDAARLAGTAIGKTHDATAIFTRAGAGARAMSLHFETVQAVLLTAGGSLKSLQEGRSHDGLSAEFVHDLIGAITPALDGFQDYILAVGVDVEGGRLAISEISAILQHLYEAHERTSAEARGKAERLVELCHQTSKLLQTVEGMKIALSRSAAMESAREKSALIVLDEFVRKPSSARIIAEMLREVSNFDAPNRTRF